jgi:hypothetical protein
MMGENFISGIPPHIQRKLPACLEPPAVPDPCDLILDRRIKVDGYNDCEPGGSVLVCPPTGFTSPNYTPPVEFKPPVYAMLKPVPMEPRKDPAQFCNDEIMGTCPPDAEPDKKYGPDIVVPAGTFCGDDKDEVNRKAAEYLVELQNGSCLYGNDQDVVTCADLQATADDGYGSPDPDYDPEVDPPILWVYGSVEIPAGTFTSEDGTDDANRLARESAFGQLDCRYQSRRLEKLCDVGTIPQPGHVVREGHAQILITEGTQLEVDAMAQALIDGLPCTEVCCANASPSISVDRFKIITYVDQEEKDLSAGMTADFNCETCTFELIGTIEIPEVPCPDGFSICSTVKGMSITSKVDPKLVIPELNEDTEYPVVIGKTDPLDSEVCTEPIVVSSGDGTTSSQNSTDSTSGQNSTDSTSGQNQDSTDPLVDDSVEKPAGHDPTRNLNQDLQASTIEINGMKVRIWKLGP